MPKGGFALRTARCLLPTSRVCRPPMPPHQRQRVFDILPNFHFARAGLAVVTQVHWGFAEFKAGQEREFEEDFGHAGKALLGDEAVAPLVGCAAERRCAVEAVAARKVAHVRNGGEELKDNAEHVAEQLAVRGDALHFCAGLEARGDDDVEAGVEFVEHEGEFARLVRVVGVHAGNEAIGWGGLERGGDAGAHGLRQPHVAGVLNELDPCGIKITDDLRRFISAPVVHDDDAEIRERACPRIGNCSQQRRDRFLFVVGGEDERDGILGHDLNFEELCSYRTPSVLVILWMTS